MSLPAPVVGARDEELEFARSVAERLSGAFRTRVVGQEGLRTSLLVTLLGRGHLLVESVPGLAKTLLCSSIARMLDRGRFQSASIRLRPAPR